jgi:hypothetical protein
MLDTEVLHWPEAVLLKSPGRTYIAHPRLRKLDRFLLQKNILFVSETRLTSALGSLLYADVGALGRWTSERALPFPGFWSRCFVILVF